MSFIHNLKSFFSLKKKGVMDNISGLAMGIVFLALIIGVGLIVLGQFGNTQGGDVNSTLQTIIGYLGTSGGGLASWIPAIIAVTVGVLLIFLFTRGKGKGRF